MRVDGEGEREGERYQPLLDERVASEDNHAEVGLDLSQRAQLDDKRAELGEGALGAALKRDATPAV